MLELKYFEKALSAKLEIINLDSSKPTLPVTVVAANYNNGQFLISFFWSLINGTTLPEKIIVVDDGSMDQSLSLLGEIERRVPIVKIIYFEKNRGFANALNAAIDEVTTAYILRIDPDDISGPDRIKAQYQFISNGRFDFVGSNAVIFDNKSEKIVTQTNFPIDSTDIVKRIKAGEHGMLHPTVMGRTSLFKLHKYRQEFVPAEDYDIFARALQAGACFGNIKESHLFYRAHGSSASTNLKYSLIEKTFNLRDIIFEVNTPKIYRYRYFLFIYSYRRYLFNKSKFGKLFYGVLASAMAPGRFLARVLK